MRTEDRIITLMTAITQRVDAVLAVNENFESVRGRVDIRDLRQQFSNGGDVHAALFDAYITPPAVTNAWKYRSMVPARTH